MNTITLEGREYILRCDLNVVEMIEEKYGSIDAVYDKTGEISSPKGKKDKRIYNVRFMIYCFMFVKV